MREHPVPPTVSGVLPAQTRAERIGTMIDPDVDLDVLDAAKAAASKEEKGDARALLDLARELSVDWVKLLELRMAFLVGGEGWQ